MGNFNKVMLLYGSEIGSYISQVDIFERKTLKRIYGSIQKRNEGFIKWTAKIVRRCILKKAKINLDTKPKEHFRNIRIWEAEKSVVAYVVHT